MPPLPVHASTTEETLDAKFHRLASAWQEAVAHHSSSRKRYSHPLYQEIIALGPAVVPLLLRDLETNGRHWFVALATLTGENPVAAEEARDVPRMTEAWVRD